MNNTYLKIISSEIVEAITQRCDCEYSINYIINEHFQCSEEQSSTCVTYRARLYGTRDQEEMVLVGYVQDWTNSNPDMIQTNQSNCLLSIDTNCEVVINSFNDSLCTCMINNNTTNGTNEIASEDSGLLRTILIIVGITVGGVSCIILIFGLVVISVYRYKKKKAMMEEGRRYRPLILEERENIKIAEGSYNV